MIKISSTLNGAKGAPSHVHHKNPTDTLVILANALAYDSNSRVVGIVTDGKSASILLIRAPIGRRVIDATDKNTPALICEGSYEDLTTCLQFVALLHEFGGSEYVMPTVMKEIATVKKPVLSPELDSLIDGLQTRSAIVAALASVVTYAATGEVKRAHITQAVHHATHNLGCAIRTPTQ